MSNGRAGAQAPRYSPLFYQRALVSAMKPGSATAPRQGPLPALARLAFCQLHGLVLLLGAAFDLGRRRGCLDRLLFDFFFFFFLLDYGRRLFDGGRCGLGRLRWRLDRLLLAALRQAILRVGRNFEQDLVHIRRIRPHDELGAQLVQ